MKNTNKEKPELIMKETGEAFVFLTKSKFAHHHPDYLKYLLVKDKINQSKYFRLKRTHNIPDNSY